MTKTMLRSFVLILLAAAAVLPLRGAELEDAPSPSENAAVDWDHIATLMDVDRFWAIIDEARQGARTPCAGAARLPRILGRLTPDEILAFALQLQKRFNESYRWDLWAVAYIVNGGASDDGFEYFRGWLIAQGREYFEAALRDPERAGDKASRNPTQNECEAMRSPGFYAYWSKTKQEMPALPLDFPAGPAGQPWEEDQVDKLYPELAARFSGPAVETMTPTQREAAVRPTQGIEMVLAVETEGDRGSADRTQDIKTAAKILRVRLRQLSIGFSVVPGADERVIVRLPSLGAAELDQIKGTLTRTGFIEFRLVHPRRPAESDPFAPAPEGYEILRFANHGRGADAPELLWVKRAPELTDTMLAQATVDPDQYGNPQITIRFTAVGRDKFAEVTRLLADEQTRTGNAQRLAIVIDGRLFSAPIVHEPIAGGSAVISGRFTHREAIELANALNNPLQIRLRIVEERTFGL